LEGRVTTARELFRAQDFPDSYDIDILVNGEPLSAEAKVRLAGNAVVPIMARRLAEANCQHLIAKERAA